MNPIRTLADVNWENPNKTPRRRGSGKSHTKTWETQDGRKIRVCDMKDNHLQNTIRFIEQNWDDAIDTEAQHMMDVSMMFGDTEGGYQLEQQADHIMQYGQDYPSIYYDMVEEAEQRGIHNGMDPDQLYFGRKLAEDNEHRKKQEQFEAECGFPEKYR